MGFFTQLGLLLWKNFTHRRRQPFRLVVEIVWPLCLFLILVAVRLRPDIKENKPECHYYPKAMPSAGSIPFLQSYMCDMYNECNTNITEPSNTVGIINTFDSSLLSVVLGDIETVLASNLDVTFLTNLEDDFQILLEVIDFLNSSAFEPGRFQFPNSAVFDATALRDQISNQNIGLTPKAVDTLLNATFDPLKLLTEANATLAREFAAIITDIASSNSLDTNSTDMLLESACDDELLLEYFEFQNEADAKDLQSQICSLSPANATQLLEDLQSSFEPNAAIDEVRNIIQNVTGKSPSLVWVEQASQVLRDLSALESIVSLFSNVQEVLSMAAPGVTGVPTSLNTLGQVFCGGDRALFTSSEETREDAEQDFEQKDESRKTNKRYDRAKKKYEDSGLPKECAAFFADFERSSFTRILWRQLKPIVLGVIPYTPDSPATRKIIKEASRTFESISALLDLTNDTQELIPSLENFVRNDIGPIRDFFSGGMCKSALQAIRDILPIVENLPLPDEFSQINNLALNDSFCDTGAEILNRTGPDGTDMVESFLNSTYYALLGFTPYIKCVNLDKFVPFADVDSLVTSSLDLIGNNTFWGALVFKNFDSKTEELPTVVKYDIRMDVDRVDDTSRIMDKYWRPGPRGRAGIDMKYFVYGFIYIQDMVDHAIIRLHTNETQEPGVYTHQFPYPCWIRDKFVFAISRSLPLFMIISWIYSVAMIIKGIVYEKEMRLKEVMKIMGLGNGVHWVAWFINSFVVMLITIIFFVIILKQGNVLEYSDPSVVFVFMLVFAVSTIALCFLVSTLFSRANLAAVCGGFVYFVIYLPYTQLVQWEDEITTTEKIIACLSSNIAMGYACSYLALVEEQAIGAQWDNIGTSPVIDDDFNLEACIWMMILDTAIYLLLTWYIEAVFPGQYGMPRKWYFPIQKSYWLGKTSDSDRSSHADNEMPDIRDHNPDLEEEPRDCNVGVAIKNLSKKYNKGQKVAVDNLSLNFYEGQITSFLGHNGAGKTTTMSILTGLFPPSSGTALIYGKDIRTSMDEIRTDLGMCPQHNVLFDLLTVEEHIWFYARLKGRTNAEVKPEMTQMINDIGLPHKRKEKSSNLSGGMKRKLSVAIAFVGGSRTVILDEPTAGVDPYARRAIWELLLKFRKGRTIVLSTHHMDEADVLGDRIAIISQGKLCTVGTSLFLKDRFGSGYYLTLVRQEKDSEKKAFDEDGASNLFATPSDSMSMQSRPSTASSVRTIVDVKPSFGGDNVDEGYDEKGSDRSDSPTPLPKKSSSKMVPGFHLPRLTAFIQKYIPGAQLVEDNSIEVCFRLPETTDHAAKFSKLFKKLETMHHELGVSSYGISDTNLEEVFLKVAEENWVEEGQEERRRTRLEENSEYGRYPRPVSKLSFRKKEKTSMFNFHLGNRVNASMERLTSDSDSVNSEENEEQGASDFSGAGKTEYVSGKKLVGRQMTALFVKRFHHVRRSKKGFISEIILPAGFVCLAMIFSLIMPPFSEMPPLVLQPWMYEPKQGSSSLNTFYSNDNPSNPRAQILEANITNAPYFGNRCMNRALYKIGGKPCLSPNVVTHWTENPLLQNVSMTTKKCSCSSGFQRCPSKAAGPKPPMQKIRTNDKFHNLSGRNISEWLVKTMEKFQKRRYGGFSFIEENPLGRLDSKQLSSSIDRLVRAANNNQSVFSGRERFWEDLEGTLKFAFVRDNGKVWFNNKGWASSVSYMNAFNNLLLRSFLPSGEVPSDYAIVTTNYPMNYTKEQLNEETLYRGAVDLVVAICVIFAMSFVPASFVLFLIEERVSNSKHLQFVSGINPTTYWIANSAWDLINYSIPALLCIFIFLAFGKDSYTSAKNFPCLLAILFLYGWSITPMMYPFSRVFSVPSSAFVALSCVNVFLGTVSTLATFILEVLAREDPDLADINDILKQVFLVLPHYCLGRGLIDMASYQLQADVIGRFGETLNYSPFDWEIVGRNIFAMAMLGFFFSILNLLIEYNFFLSWLFISKNSVSKVKNKDVDVAREEQRVLSGAAADDIMRLEGLTKVYWTPGKKGKMTAVDHLYVGVPKGQCFGLLGVNGAGKTTTFKMLTGDVGVSEGDAYINKYSVRKDMVQVRRFMGYCPQFDALDPLLTGREHLEFYARVRGIKPSQIKSVAAWAIKRLGLTPHAEKISSAYSGGNKRKLSTAIALIGNPPIIFLDEPTTGMDPSARRFLWNCINNIVKAGRSVILTSHSMEECEALCSRLAIMVNGTFQCLGSTQHLKTRFGNGYTIILRVSGQNPDVTPVMQFITTSFPSAKLREKHHNMLQYQLGTNDLSLSQLFASMEEAKAKFGVEDYSVSQTTLDQVFINFAKKQTDMLDDELDEQENPEDNFDDDIDNLSRIYNADSLSTAMPSEFDEDSMAGSTFELIRPGSGRSQTHANGGGSQPKDEMANISVRL